MSSACAAIPYGPDSPLLRPRPRRSGASSETSPSSARATATHVWLLEVMPWIASTGSRCSLVPPIRNVASDPPGTRTSVLAVDDKRTLLLIDAGIRRHRRREFIRPLSH